MGTVGGTFRDECIDWVLVNEDLSLVSKLTLGKEVPTREKWFAVILPDLDYEIEGGTQDIPRWAWEDHPWFTYLALTYEECFAALQKISQGEPLDIFV